MSLELDRRALLRGVLALCTAAALPRPSNATERGADEQLAALLDRFMQENLRAAPELATSLGLDTGALSHLRSRLNDRSSAGRAAQRALLASQLERLQALDPGALSSPWSVHYRSMREMLGTRADIAHRFRFGEPGSGNPYSISQMTGAYGAIPDFLDSKHPLQNREDVEAYLERVRAFALALDQQTTSVREDANVGVLPPEFVIERTLAQLRALRAVAPRSSIAVSSLARRSAHIESVAGAVRETLRAYEQQVLPALDRQITALERLQRTASPAAGVWALPEGEAYYAACLRASTSSARTPQELHSTGLALVEDISASIDAALRQQGLRQGTVAERMRALYEDPGFHYPDTDAGRAQLMAYVRGRLEIVRDRLPRLFIRRPQVVAEVRAVPAYLEEGSPAAYYHDPSIDGSRPGIYYINLRDTRELPRWYLPTVSFHEAVPGHHLQQAIAQEAQLPLIRKVMWSQAYGEGWGLYAEQLADELGMYEDDPWGRIGYLWAALLRACRLVADTGLHAQRWSRERAIEWMSRHSGAGTPMVVTEVERYCIQPGQACSYMVGKLVWNDLRRRFTTGPGAHCDVRRFHEVALRYGAMPLSVLEAVAAEHMGDDRA